MEFSLHTYLKPLREKGASEAFISAIRRNAQPLLEAELPVLLTQGHIAHAVGLNLSFVEALARRQVDPYRVFVIRKRSGGRRFICVPEPELLKAQRWIHEEILSSVAALKLLSHNCTAYVPKSSHKRNAELHVGAKWFLKLDITRFFESISERQVYHVFRLLGYRALVAFYLTRLCTRILPAAQDMRRHSLKRQKKRTRWDGRNSWLFGNSAVVGHLPQGAPTSPMLANLVCIQLDAAMLKIAVKEDLIYSRYADDMVLSGTSRKRPEAIRLSKIATTTVSNYGFDINTQKTRMAKHGTRMIVTGLSISNDTLRLPRPFRDDLRQDLYYIEKYGLDSHCDHSNHKNKLSYLLRLDGRLRYAASIEPDFANELINKLRQIAPDLPVLRQLFR